MANPLEFMMGGAGGATSLIDRLLEEKMNQKAQELQSGFMPQTAPQPPGALNLQNQGGTPAPQENPATSVLERLRAINENDPRSVVGGINDAAQPFLRKLGPIGSGISKGVDFLEGIGDSFRGAAERGVMGGVAPRLQAGVMAARDQALREMQLKAMMQPKPQESYDVLSEQEKAALGLNPDMAYRRNAQTGKVEQIGQTGTQLTVNTGDQGGPRSIFDVPAGVFSRFEGLEEGGRSAEITRNASAKALQLVRSGQVYSGLTGDLKQLGARVLDAFSDPNSTDQEIQEARDKLAGSEAFDSQAGIMVGQIIRLFGSGTGLSDADREYAKQIAGALRSGSQQGLEAILENGFNRASREIEQYNSAIQNTGISDIGSMFRPIEMQDYDFSRPPSEIPEGIDATLWNYLTPEEQATWRKNSQTSN